MSDRLERGYSRCVVEENRGGEGRWYVGAPVDGELGDIWQGRRMSGHGTNLWADPLGRNDPGGFVVKADIHTPVTQSA